MNAPALPERRPFLTATWSHLCLLTYAVDPARLASRLPTGLSLDTRDGNAFVSLVAFDFLDTRVLGIPWPGYRNFPEINLRFYVRKGDRRGVMFVREYVPKHLLAWVARALYNEPYKAAPMTSSWLQSDTSCRVEHVLRVDGSENRLSVDLDPTPALPAADSEAHFFKEHSWGYGRSRRGRLLEYQVWHPIWETLPVRTFELSWDWAKVYGPEWADLSDAKPHHVAFAIGSDIRVYPKTLMG